MHLCGAHLLIAHPHCHEDTAKTLLRWLVCDAAAFSAEFSARVLISVSTLGQRVADCSHQTGRTQLTHTKGTIKQPELEPGFNKSAQWMRQAVDALDHLLGWALDMLNGCCVLRPNPQENNGMATIPALVPAIGQAPSHTKGQRQNWC